jgi:hypothetical protein
MGGERSSTSRQRQEGKICAMCRRPLDYNIWDANPGERLCNKCIAERAAPTQTLISVYMSFFLQGAWYCQFLDEDLKTSLPRKLTFADPTKVIELIKRGDGYKSLEQQQAVEHAIANGRGGVYLKLSQGQYEKLKTV